MTVSFPKKLHHTIPTQSWKKKTEEKIILSGAYISVHRSLTEFPAAEIVGWFARNSTGFVCFYKVSTAGNQG